MSTKIVLARHGVTDWNYEGRAQGQSDIPLNSEGRWQADQLGKRLGAEPWDAVYSSTLARAYETAQAVAKHQGLTVSKDARLMERGFGVAEGSRHAERQARWPGVSVYELPGVESNEAVATRATECLTEIAERHPGANVLCVAHGGLISEFLSSLSPGAIPFRHQRNTAVTRLIYEDGKFQVEAPSCHLHILVDGVEYTAEGGRLGATLGQVDWHGLDPDHIRDIVGRASAVEAAWDGDDLVAFMRVFTDGVTAAYVDILKVKPGYEQVVPTMRQRLMARFPGVAVKLIADATHERVPLS